MALMKRVLLRLLPPGLPWQVQGDWSALLDAVATSIERARGYLGAVVDESIPGNADETIPEWADELGVLYAPNINTAVMRQRIRAANSATGGQSIDYLQRQLVVEFPRVDNPSVSRVSIVETGPMSIELRGDVDTPDQFARLIGITGRIFPVHVARSFNVIVLFGSAVARCSVGVSGVMRCGNFQEGLP